MATTVFELLAKLGLDSSEYEQGLGKAKSTASAFGSGLASAAKVGLQAVTAATTAMVGFGAASVKTGMDFDQSMSQVYATMGDKAQEMVNYNGEVVSSMEALRDFAQEQGRTTKYTAAESADALNYMALAGYNAEESMSMLPNVMNLASAGAFDLARASDMLTDTQTALGWDMNRTSKAVDEWAKAASTGNTSVEQLGDAFLRVGGLAKELNGGMVMLKDGTMKAVDGSTELSIALTAMANAGIKGEEAGTHMRNMLLKLSNPTSDGTKALEEMGVAIFDDEENMRSLTDIFGDLSTELGNLTQEAKIQTIADLFNVRDLSSAEALLGAVEGTVVKIGDEVYSMGTAYEKFGDAIYDSSQGFEIIQSSWDEIGESIINSEGAAEKMADTQLDNLAGDVVKLKSAFEGMQIAISDGLSPQLREFVQFGTEGLSRLTGAFKEGGIDSAMEEFGSILSDGLNMIIEKAPQFIDAGMKLLGALGQGILDNLDVILDSAQTILVELGKGLIVALPKLQEGVFEVITSLGQFLVEEVPAMVPSIIDLILSMGKIFIDNAPLMIEAAAQIVLGLAEGLIDALPELIPTVVEMILTLVEMLTEPDMLVQLINAAVLLIGALAEGLIQALPVLIERLPIIILNIVETLARLGPQLVVSGIQLIIQLVFGIISGIPKVISAFLQIREHIFERLGEIKDSAKTWGKDMIDNFINGIKEKWEDLKTSLKETAETIKAYLGFSEPEDGPLSNFHTYAPDMMQLFAEGITDNASLITDAINSSFNLEPPIKSSYNNDIGSVQNGTQDSQPVPVTVVLQGDAGKFFTAMVRENDVYTKANGVSAFA